MNQGNHAERSSEMRMVYRDECPAKPTVYKWIERYKKDWDTYEGTVRAGRPKSSGLRRNVQLIEKYWMKTDVLLSGS